MHLDVTTLRVTESAIALLLALLSAILWLTRRMYAGFGWWTLAKILAGVGYVLVMFLPATAYIAPIILAALGSVILSFEACRSFFGYTPKLGLDIGASSACLILLAYGGVVLRSRGFITIVMFLTIGTLYACTAWVLFRAKAHGAVLGRVTTAISFTVLAAIYFLTVIGPTTTNFAALRTWMAAYMMASQLGLIISNFGFFLMHYERLLHDRGQEAEQAATANRELRELKEHLQETIEKKTDELMRVQKLESIGRLAGGMAHDFNNLLAVVQGHASLVQAKMPHGNPLRPHVDKIVNVCEEASSLTERLLAVGKHHSFERGIVQLNQVIRRMEVLVRDIVGARIELITNLDPSLGVAVADRGQLRQVLMNLVLNARDAMPLGGTLAVGTSNVEIAEGQVAQGAEIPAGAYITLSVSDTGRGMDEHTRSRILEPFFTTKGSQGTGLGLATVHSIVQESGGYIQIESRPSQGTTFRIFFPRVAQPPQLAHTPAHFEPTAAESPRARILIVEDYQELRSLIGEVLREEGYAVLEAATGTEALSVLRDHDGRLDLVMTDLAMPEMDGQTFAQKARMTHPELKIVFMSAYPEAVLEHAEGQPNGIPVLRKPFTDEDLTARIREVLNPA